MISLTEFLLARIAEDEAMARADEDGDGWAPGTDGLYWMSDHAGDHIAVEPRRVLAECEAKRRIVSECYGEVGALQVDAWLLPVLALPYADHPEFQEAWRV